MYDDDVVVLSQAVYPGASSRWRSDLMAAANDDDQDEPDGLSDCLLHVLNWCAIAVRARTGEVF